MFTAVIHKDADHTRTPYCCHDAVIIGKYHQSSPSRLGYHVFDLVAISAILNVILNASFIPQWGATGAAMATAISTVVWNIFLVIFVKQKLKINMNPLSFRNKILFVRERL